MKRLKSLPILLTGTLALLFASCENQNIDFPDFGKSSVYFAYQYPVRTIVLGEDKYDTTLDNQHKCKIYATMGGVYANNKNITIDVKVDNTLCNNLYFENGNPVKAMPTNYYSLASDKISLNKTLSDGVEVQLTDAFFKDPDALVNTYVIPLLMTHVTNADQMLSGTLSEGVDPVKCDPTAWIVQPKDYVLYCVKYINEWHANYLRRGVDQITENGVTTTNVRHQQYVEKDEECSTVTRTLKSIVFPVSTKVRTGTGGNETVETLTCKLILTFNENNECTITSGTDAYTASGSGKYVKKGEKKSWGNKDRDALYLDYQIDFNAKKYATKDTLVVHSRGISSEEFSPSYTKE